MPELTPDESDETPARVFYEAAARFLDAQLRVNEALDTRTATSFSVGSTVLPVTFGLLALAPDRLPDDAGWVLRGAVVAYIVLLVRAFIANGYRGLEYRPRLDTLHSYTRVYRGDALLQWVAQQYMTSTEINERELDEKARWTGWAGIALYAEGLLLALAALLTLT